MTSFVKVPMRIAIGSNLAIVLLSSIVGFIGKAATDQIEWLMVIPLGLTVIPAVRCGSIVSKRISVRWLRKALAVLIGAAAIKMALSVVFP